MKFTFKILTIVFIGLFITLNTIYFRAANSLSWDVFGYYLYLPLTFIYHDLSLKDLTIVNEIIEKYHNTITFYQGVPMPNGNHIIKYTAGISIFYSPFFFIGHIAAKILNYPTDGFSLPYQYAIVCGGLIYALIGILALAKVLSRFFSDKIVAFVLLIIVFGTNYIPHITMYSQNTMSHNYLFMTYALILWFTIRWHETKLLKFAIGLGILCGLTILSRPSEIVCLIIPALWGVSKINFWEERWNYFKTHIKHLILFSIIVLCIGSIQLIYWKIYTGKLFFNSYGGNAGEGFEFLSPFTLQVLFSFRKGWLIYTPVMIFAILGFIELYRKNRSVFYALFIYFLLNLYIVSSWSCWWYAETFSQRALIPSYPIMAISLGYFLEWIKNNRLILNLSIALIISMIGLNVFQTTQFHKGIIHGARMTKDYYFATFGKLDEVSEDTKKLLLINRSFDGKEQFENLSEYQLSKIQKLDFENSDKRDTSIAYLGNASIKLDSNINFSPNLELKYSEITEKDHAWIRISAWIYPTQDLNKHPCSIVANFKHKKYEYKYKAFDLDSKNIKINQWNKVTFDYLTPEVRRKSNKLQVYAWYRGKAPLYLDDLQIEAFEPLRGN